MALTMEEKIREIHKALYVSDLARIEKLLKQGIDPHASLEGTPSIFSAACFLNAKDAVRMLLDAGADPNKRDKLNNLTGIFLTENTEITAMLIAAGADVNARATDGTTPLFYIPDLKCLKMAKMLIDAGANVNARNKHGMTLLTMAMWTGKGVKGAALSDDELRTFTHFMISSGADVLVPARNGKTAYDYAVEKGHAACAALLAEAMTTQNAQHAARIAQNNRHLGARRLAKPKC